jgi:hypothetical protein
MVASKHMSLPHYSTLKIAALATGIAAAIYALDPKIQTAIIAGLIAAIPPTIVGVLNFLQGRMNRKNIQKIEVSINGKLDKFMETSQKLSHAEGRREGLEAAQKDSGQGTGKAKL